MSLSISSSQKCNIHRPWLMITFSPFSTKALHVPDARAVGNSLRAFPTTHGRRAVRTAHTHQSTGSRQPVRQCAVIHNASSSDRRSAPAFMAITTLGETGITPGKIFDTRMKPFPLVKLLHPDGKLQPLGNGRFI